MKVVHNSQNERVRKMRERHRLGDLVNWFDMLQIYKYLGTKEVGKDSDKTGAFTLRGINSVNKVCTVCTQQ